MWLFNELSELLLPIFVLIIIIGGIGGLVWDAASKKKK